MGLGMLRVIIGIQIFSTIQIIFYVIFRTKLRTFSRLTTFRDFNFILFKQKSPRWRRFHLFRMYLFIFESCGVNCLILLLFFFLPLLFIFVNHRTSAIYRRGKKKKEKKAKGKKYRREKFGKSKRKKMVIADAVLFVRKQISRARGSIQIVAVFI